QQVRTVGHFRLTGGADDARRSLRQCCGAQDVDRSEDGRPLGPAEVHGGALEASARHFADDVPVLVAEGGAELLEPAEVEVDGPVADGAPAGHAEPGLAA